MSGDGLRDEIAALLIQHTRTRIEDCHCGWGVNTGALGQSHALHVADAVLPVVQAHIDAAREQVAEQIAQALAAVPGEVYPEDVFGPVTTDDTRQIHELLKTEGLPSLDRISANIMRHAYSMAARIAREYAKGDGDE